MSSNRVINQYTKGVNRLTKPKDIHGICHSITFLSKKIRSIRGCGKFIASSITDCKVQMLEEKEIEKIQRERIELLLNYELWNDILTDELKTRIDNLLESITEKKSLYVPDYNDMNTISPDPNKHHKLFMKYLQIILDNEVYNEPPNVTDKELIYHSVRHLMGSLLYECDFDFIIQKILPWVLSIKNFVEKSDFTHELLLSMHYKEDNLFDIMCGLKDSNFSLLNENEIVHKFIEDSMFDKKYIDKLIERGILKI